MNNPNLCKTCKGEEYIKDGKALIPCPHCHVGINPEVLDGIRDGSMVLVPMTAIELIELEKKSLLERCRLVEAGKVQGGGREFSRAIGFAFDAIEEAMAGLMENDR